MKHSGIIEFQEKRKQIMKTLIEEASTTLFQSNLTSISAKEVSKKVQELAKKKNIDPSYIVSEQTIGRTKAYNVIWKKYKKQQLRNLNSPTNNYEPDDFKLRDAYDLLSQEYIELLDSQQWTDARIKELTDTNHRLQESLESNSNPQRHSALSFEILKIIKNILHTGSVVITKKNGNILIKSYDPNNQERFLFSAEEWETI